MERVTPNKRIIDALMNAMEPFVKTYNIAITAILGIVTITVLIMLFINITRISAAMDNDMRRREAINGTLVCLVCLALIGGIDTVYAVLLSFIM